MIEAALTDYPSTYKQLSYLKKVTGNLLFSSAYCQSLFAFAFCFVELFQYHKYFFGNIFSINFGLLKKLSKETVQNDCSKSAEERLLPEDLNWSLVVDSFLSRYPSDTDNQIYLKSKTRIWNPILLVLILCTASLAWLNVWYIGCLKFVIIRTPFITTQKTLSPMLLKIHICHF